MHIEDWKSSGLSKVEYCKENRIHYGTFQSWIRKSNPDKVVEWKPIAISEEPEESENFFEFRIGENWKLEINLRIRL